MERFDQSCEQRNIAHADGWVGQPEMGGGLKPKRDGLAICRGLIRTPKRFDAGLPEFACPVGFRPRISKDGTEIAETLRLPGKRRSQVFARDRNGQIGTQAEFMASGVSREIHALADVFAR